MIMGGSKNVAAPAAGISNTKMWRPCGAILNPKILKKKGRGNYAGFFPTKKKKNSTHRKTKNPRSKKFRYIGFMETFNI